MNRGVVHGITVFFLAFTSVMGVGLASGCRGDEVEPVDNPLGAASPAGFFQVGDELTIVTESEVAISGIPVGGRIYQTFRFVERAQGGFLIETSSGTTGTSPDGEDMLKPNDSLPHAKFIVNERMRPTRVMAAKTIARQIVGADLNQDLDPPENDFERGMRDGFIDSLVASVFPTEHAILMVYARDFLTLAQIYACEAARNSGLNTVSVQDISPISTDYQPYTLDAELGRTDDGGRTFTIQHVNSPDSNASSSAASPVPSWQDRVKTVEYQYDERAGFVSEWSVDEWVSFDPGAVPPGEPLRVHSKFRMKLTLARP